MYTYIYISMYIYVYMYIYLYTRVRACVPACMRACVHACVRACALTARCRQAHGGGSPASLVGGARSFTSLQTCDTSDVHILHLT